MPPTARRARALPPLLALAACGGAWNALNRGGLERDVREVLGVHGVVPAALDCRMMGTTRAGTCTAQLDPAQVAALVRGLGLARAASGSPALGHLETGASCRACALFSAAPPSAVWSATGRPAALRLRSGGAFEYLLLYETAGARDVCLQVSYAYG